MVRITVSTFKEDTENNLVHMKNFMQLSEPPFQRDTKGTKEEETSKANEDEAESTRKA